MDEAPRPPPPLPPHRSRPRAVRSRRRSTRTVRLFALILLTLVFAVAIGLVVQGVRRESRPSEEVGRDHTTSARLAALPLQRADVVREGDSIIWTDGAQRRYRVVEILGEGDVRIRTPHGDLVVDQATFKANTAGPPAALPALVATAHDASLDPSGLRAETGIVTGIRLASPEAIVLPGAVLRRDPGAGRDTAGEQEARIRRLRQEVDRFLASLPPGGLEASVMQAVTEVLHGLPERDGRTYWGSLQPHVTRRLVRHGWLKLLDAPQERVDALVAAVQAACRPLLTRRYVEDGHSLTYRESSFGRQVVAYRTPSATRYSCPQPQPQWLSHVPERTAVVDLPPGADPLASRIGPTAAAVYCGSIRLASWRAGSPLEPTQGAYPGRQAWADEVQAHVGKDHDVNREVFPPHIVLANALGDVYALITPYGELHPAKDGSRSETRRFLDEASLALPRAAYLDLIGEVLYDYAWDTTAYDRPLLVGTQTDNGDIHQTLPQTLATCAGGCYRGDCDDMACFYHALARHQGHNALVMKQPWHLACAWADQRKDGTWTTYVLHTGPPLQFFGRDLDEVLRATYAHFRSQETIDLQSLPFALRFGDDAVRRTYLLPGEIFADRTYALALIAVQGSYRDHTYLSGVDTMQAVMATRKKPTCADYSEIASLLTWAGRYAEATQAFQQALAKAPAEEARVDAALALLGNLVRRDETERAGELTTDLTLRWIPQLERARSRKLVGPWMRVATTLATSKDEVLRLRGLQVIAYQARERAAPSFNRIAMLAARKDFNPQWLHYQGLPLHETNVTTFVQGAIAALGATRKDPSPEAQDVRKLLDDVVRQWFQHIAFRTIHTQESRLARHGILAAWYATRVVPEKLAAAIDAAGPPTAEDVGHMAPASLGPGLPDARTLRLLHITPDVHRSVWWRALASPAEGYDPGAARRALHAERAAYDTAQTLGLEHWSHPPGRLMVRLGEALVDQDEAGFREAIARIAALRDHDLRGQVAQLMQLAALRLEVPAFERWLRVWAAQLDDDGRDGFEIAWGAMLADRPQHALVAARLTAEHHPNHTSFATELAHIQKLVR